MPYYRKRRKSRDDTWVFMAFGVLVSVVGLIVALSLLSVGLLGIGMGLHKLFPALTLFQAALFPLVLLVFIGLYVTVVLSTVDLKDALTLARAESAPVEEAAPLDSAENWRYRHSEASRLDI